jgi:prepilin-type N-terminal cleavage/methylation domain-containing protein
MKTALKAFSLIEVMIVVAIIGVLMAISIPNISKARLSATRNVCIGNLHQIEAAKRIWALEKLKGPTDIPVDSELFGSSNYLRDKPICPAGGTYTLNALANYPSCALFSTQGHSL